MGKGRSWIALCVVLGWAGALRAQVTDPFDLDSFIDPRDLGAVMKINAKTVPGSQYEMITTSVGHLWNYQDRETFTKQNREFGTLGYFRYWSDWQADATLAVLDHQSSATQWRARFDVDKYSLLASTSNNMDFVGRTGISLVLDDDLGSSGTKYEVSATTTVQTSPIVPEVLRILGSAAVSYRRGDGENIFRAIYSTSGDLPRPDSLRDRVRFNAGFWLGYETEGGRGRVLPFKGRGLVDYYFSERFGLEISYGPAYQFASAGVPRGFNNEWMIMVFGNVYSHRTRPPVLKRLQPLE
jgi:hypothetical protein